jgi:hypothetical protein
MDKIIDHRQGPDAVSQSDAFIISKNGRQRKRTTTKGWDLLIRWKDGSETWTPLNDMKESYMVETAEYNSGRIAENIIVQRTQFTRRILCLPVSSAVVFIPQFFRQLL